MTSFRQTNSWHWLLMAMFVCLPVAAYLCHWVWKKSSEEDAPKLQGMQNYMNELKLLDEEDVFLHEHQAANIQKRLNAYEAATQKAVGQPIPKGEQAVLILGNEINRALLKHQLRVVEQEQVEYREVATPTAAAAASPEARAAARAAAARQAAAAQIQPGLPFNTREIRYVVEGEYKHMFMFLVRQSHLKPSYHFKDIKIHPSIQQYGMRMEFTVQIHFT